MINDIQDEINRAREQQRLNIPAKRILEKIQSIPADIEKLQRRWFWELLQNASDYNDEVEIILELYPNKVVFKHNGKPFRPLDAENLIAPDSGKDDQDLRTDDMIGQFGTGFISTHVLSSHISITGIIQSENTNTFHNFKYTLDRSGFTDKEKLKKSITITSEELNNSIKATEYKIGNFDTSFTYDLTKNLPGIKDGEAVKFGLEYVFEVLPYTLAFMSKVKKVTIKNYKTEFVDYVEQIFIPDRSKDDFKVSIGTSIENVSDWLGTTLIFKTLNEGDATVIVSVKDKKIQTYPDKLTKLFCFLPMIGTEDFSSPIAINSGKFKPKTERDGIKLSTNSTVNREIIVSASQAYKKLIDQLIEEDFDGFYNIIKWTKYSGDDTETEWFSKNVITPIKEHLLDAKIVRTTSGRESLEKAKIPYFTLEELKKEQHNEFYSLCLDFIPELVPIQGDFLSWFTNIDFNVFRSCKYELTDLLSSIEDFENISTLNQNVKNCKPWLIRLIEMTIKINPNLLDQYKIIPNQLGTFKLRKDNLFYDDNLDEELIKIHNEIAEPDYQEILLDSDFDKISGLLEKESVKTEKLLAKTIDDLFSLIPEANRSGRVFQTGLRSLFRWFSESGKEESELKDLFKWFSNKKPQLFLETIPDYDRAKVLTIAQSDKLDSLSKLANSKITKEELDLIVDNQSEFEDFLAWKESLVDDTKASKSLGDIGEQIVYDVLMKRFENENNVEVEWSAKRNEARYDFEVKKDGKPWLFIDAKTTNQGIANADSVPFFMRMAQWDFLPTLTDNQMYFVARVFYVNEKGDIKWLKLKDEKIQQVEV